MLAARQLLVTQAKVNLTLNEMQRTFRYYRLALYSFAMAPVQQILVNRPLFHNPRIQEAAARLLQEDLMNVILVGGVEEVKSASAKNGFDGPPRCVSMSYSASRFRP